jgi:cold-inducible RNA-binding protein
MSKKMYVGNLAWSVTSEDLQELFAAHGSVRSAEVIQDRETGRSRGFGFVEMETQQDMEAAIQALNGYDLKRRPRWSWWRRWLRRWRRRWIRWRRRIRSPLVLLSFWER